MRYAAKVDDNQADIVKALRGVGVTVEVLSRVGSGCPDILCGFRGSNWLMEIKDPTKPKRDRQLTPDQKRWHADWRGQVTVVECPDDALRVIGAIE